MRAAGGVRLEGSKKLVSDSWVQELGLGDSVCSLSR